MPTLAQDSNGDLLLDAGKRLTVVTGAAEVAVKVRSRLKLATGEFWLDTRVGTPHLQRILGIKAPDLNVIKALYSKILLETPGVAGVNSLAVALDGKTRALSVAFSVRASAGGTVTATSLDKPFVVVEA